MPAGYTEIRYNDIILRDVLTKSFDQKPVLDADGQTLLYHRFTVVAQGYFVSGSEPSRTVEIEQEPRSLHDTAGARYGYLADNISAERKPFQMTVGVGGPQPRVILYCEPPPATTGVLESSSQLYEYYDRNGGPRVRNVQIDEIVANETFRVNVTFEICLRPYSDCESPSANPLYHYQRAYGVISNRWSCVDVTDEHRYTTRTYQGMLTFSSPSINPHEFRYLCLPPLHEGFMRKKMDFVAQEDGLRLKYTILDEQVTVTPPGMGTEFSDGTSMRVSQRETVGKMATYVLTNLDITLHGTPHTNRKELFLIAAVYADAKLAMWHLIRPVDPPQPGEEEKPATVYVESYVMHEEYDTGNLNQVSLSIQIRRTPDSETGRFGMLRTVAQNFGNEVNGGLMAGATQDERLQAFLQDYNQYQSWGNRTWPSGIHPAEAPQITGVSTVAAALAVHLQGECSLDFSICAGIKVGKTDSGNVGNTRVNQLRASRASCPNPTMNFAVRSNVPDLDSEYMSEDHKANVYEEYRIESEYRKDQLTIPVPIARPVDSYSSGPPPLTSRDDSNAHTAFIALGPSQNMRVVNVKATRWGSAPKLPRPFSEFVDDDGVRNVLLKHHILPMAPELTGNKDLRVFSVEAEYVYALSHEPKRLLTGVPEYESTTRDGLKQFVLPTTDLYAGRDVEYTV